MKSEERHELQQNDLENFMYYRLPHYLRQYGAYILLGLSLCFLGYTLWSRYRAKEVERVQKAWVDLAVASDPTASNPLGKLRDCIRENDVRAVKAQAYLRIGRFYLDLVMAGNPEVGLRDVRVKNREEALAGAQEAFEKVISDFADQPLAVAAAHLNLGVVAEDRGEWDDARKQYEIVADDKGPWANSGLASAAKRKIKGLDELKTQVAFGPKSLGALLEESMRNLPPQGSSPLLNTTQPFGPVNVPSSAPASAPATQKK